MARIRENAARKHKTPLLKPSHAPYGWGNRIIGRSLNNYDEGSYDYVSHQFIPRSSMHSSVWGCGGGGGGGHVAKIWPCRIENVCV